MVRVVFVCTGNICRSPMAEALLREKWKQQGYDGLVVSSMGIHGLENQEASQFAQDIFKENNLDLSEHRSRSSGQAVFFVLVFFLQLSHARQLNARNHSVRRSPSFLSSSRPSPRQGQWSHHSAQCQCHHHL